MKIIDKKMKTVVWIKPENKSKYACNTGVINGAINKPLPSPGMKENIKDERFSKAQ